VRPFHERILTANSSRKLSIPSIKLSPPVLLFNESQKHRTIRQQGAVAFDERVQVRNTIHHRDYSDDEMDSTWYSELEYKSFSCVRVRLDMAKESSSIPCNSSTDDGLGCMGADGDTEEVKDEVYNQGIERSIHCESILMEQDFQMKMGNWDPEHLAEVSQQLSRLSVAVARQKAILNQLSIWSPCQHSPLFGCNNRCDVKSNLRILTSFTLFIRQSR